MATATGEQVRMVAGYVAWMQASAMSELTVRQRVRQANALCRDVDVVTASTGELVGWLARPQWRASTRASARAGVRTFFRYLHAVGWRADDPSAALPRVRVPRGCPTPASERALDRARDACRNPAERAMLELATRAGLRRAEIAALRFTDVQQDDDGWTLRVLGKGSRVRLVPVDEALARLVLSLAPEYVFPGRRFGSHTHPNHVGDVLSRLLGPGQTAHMLRHRYATRAYRGSHDLLAVQQLLGHSTPSVTQGYVRVGQDELRAAAAAAI